MLYSKIKDQLIDVNLNRLSEGIKALEDLTRFYIKDKKNLGEIRILKKNLWNNFGKIRKEAISSRKSEKDLGRRVTFDIHKRGNLVDILTVNFKRCQESSRVLEEIFKTINSRHAKFLKTMRFQLYDMEKALLKQIKIEFDPRRYVILDIETIGRKHLKQITRACIRGGATMIQLREPIAASAKQWLQDALKIQDTITNLKIKLIINNRVDVALAINADGAHIGQDDMPLKDARRLLGDDKIIGVTAVNVIQAKQAEKQGANYIGVGAIFPTPTKSEAPVIGIKTLGPIVKAVKTPVVAIGGINSENAKKVFKTGTSGVAVISAVFHGIDFNKSDFTKKIIINLKKPYLQIEQNVTDQ